MRPLGRERSRRSAITRLCVYPLADRQGGRSDIAGFLNRRRATSTGSRDRRIPRAAIRAGIHAPRSGISEGRAAVPFSPGPRQKIALGTSAKAKDLPAYKKAAGIEDIPLIELSSDDAVRSKPYPDIFNEALLRLELCASEVVVVGDSPYDVEAARGAGMTAIALLCGGFSEALLVKSGASAIFRDPEHLLRASKEAIADLDPEEGG